MLMAWLDGRSRRDARDASARRRRTSCLLALLLLAPGAGLVSGQEPTPEADVATVQDGRTHPPLPGLDGQPLATGSPIFFNTYPVKPSGGGPVTMGTNHLTGRVLVASGATVTRGEFDASYDPPRVAWQEITPPGGLVGQLAVAVDPWAGLVAAVAVPNLIEARKDPNEAEAIGAVRDLRGAGHGFISRDDGDSWTLVATPVLVAFENITITFGPYRGPRPPTATHPSALYACGGQGIEADGKGLAQCARSDDGGFTWGPAVEVSGLACGSRHGQVKVGPDGVVYLPFQECVDEDGTRRQGWMRSEDNGLTWDGVVIPGSLASHAPPGLAVDAAGNVYAAFVQGQSGRFQPQVAVTAGGVLVQHQFDLGGPFGLRNVSAPSVLAGDEGRAAVAFFGTVDVASPSAPWTLYVATTYDLGATFTTVPVLGASLGGGVEKEPPRPTFGFVPGGEDPPGPVGHVHYTSGVVFSNPCPIGDCFGRDGSAPPAAMAALALQLGGPTLRASEDPSPRKLPLVHVRVPGTAVHVGDLPIVEVSMAGLPPLEAEWDLDGDRVYDDAFGPMATFPADRPGTYRVGVLVTDAAGDRALGFGWIRVVAEGEPPVIGGREVARFDFDSASCGDAEGWFAVSPGTVGTPGWHLTPAEEASAPCAWYNGIDATQQYAPAVATDLVSPGGDQCLVVPANARSSTLVATLAGHAAPGDELSVWVRPGSCSPAPKPGEVHPFAFAPDAEWLPLPSEPTPPRPGEPVQHGVDLSGLMRLGGGPFQVRYHWASNSDAEVASGWLLDDVLLVVEDSAPSIRAPTDVTIFDTEVLDLEVELRDPDDDPLEGRWHILTHETGTGNEPLWSTRTTVGSSGFAEDVTTGRFRWPLTGADNGIYNLTIEASDGLHQVTHRINLTVLNVPPIPAGTASTTEADRLLPVHFRDASTDADGEVVAWLWDFGDGTRSDGRNPSHLYKQLGTFDVRLTVTDDDGDRATALVARIEVVNVPPRGQVQDDEPGAAEAPVEFEANRVDPLAFEDASTDPDGEVVAWAWDFGDGASSSEQHPHHQYTTLGTFGTTLRATDNDGDHGTGAATVRVVNLLPQPDFATDPPHPMVLAPTEFLDTSADRDGEVVAWHWDFGDGFTSDEQDPLHAFLEGGWYAVTLTVTDNDQGTSTLVREVYVCMPGASVDSLVSLEHVRLEFESCVTVGGGVLPG